jgi:hypothetical protein
MSPGPLFSRIASNAFSCCLVLSAAACTGVASIDPTISPDEAIAVPRLIGDWVQVGEDADTTRLHVRQGPDSTSYVIEVGDPIRLRSVSLGRMTLLARVVQLAEGFLAEVTPLSADAAGDTSKGRYGDILMDTLQHRYGTLILQMHMVGVLKFAGDDLQVSGLSATALREAVAGGQCPEPGRLIDQDEVILTGNTRQLRRTTDCLLALPQALDQPPGTYRRAPAPRRR